MVSRRYRDWHIPARDIQGDQAVDNFLPEAVIAVETTLADGLGSTDDLCCGTAGKVDYLLEASRHLKEPVFTTNAWDVAHLMARNAGLRGSYRWRLMRRHPESGIVQWVGRSRLHVPQAGRPKDVPMLLLWEAEQR